MDLNPGLLLVIVGGVVFLLLITVLIVSSLRTPTSPAESIAQPEEAVPDAEVEIETEVAEQPQPPSPHVLAPPEPRKVPKSKESVSERFTRGLTRTRSFLAEKIAAVTKRGPLDEDAWEEVTEALIRSDVGVGLSGEITDNLKRKVKSPDDLTVALRDEIATLLDRGDREMRVASPGPSVWIVTGVNGAGKTTSIAKLAHRLRKNGSSVVLAAADTFRAAAAEQLEEWARKVGVHLVRHEAGGDPGAVVFDAIAHAKAQNVDFVIVDTAGRLHTKVNLMEELKKIKRVVERQVESVCEVLLVLDATVGQNGISQAEQFKESVEVTGIVLTKLDGSARGGIVIAVQDKLGIPVKFVGLGESLDDLEPFDPKTFAAALIT